MKIKSSEIEKIAQFLHSHTLNMWRDVKFVRLSAEELADRSNFVFVGYIKECTAAAQEMIHIADRYLRYTKNGRFSVVGVRVEESKTVMGYSGDEVQLLLKPNDNSAEFVLVMFAASRTSEVYFTHELLPYAQFSARIPLLEESTQDIPGVSSQPVPDPRAARPTQSFATSVGMVTVDTRTDTVSFRNCSYSLQDRHILVSGKQATFREDVPRAFVSAVNAIKSKTEVTRRIADGFQEDYSHLRKKKQNEELTGPDGRRILKTSAGAFSFLEDERVIYTSDKGGFACEYVPGVVMLFLDGSRVRRYQDIPREFLQAVVETNELGYPTRNGIADAVRDCIPANIKNTVSTNVIAWCLSNRDSVT